MPRHRRLDLPGCIYHVITRGIERKKIFRDKFDREDFLTRLSDSLTRSQSQCLGWCLMPNHFHLLIRTGKEGLSSLMRSVLSGYAIHFNHRHKRHGYLYQNRYKSILCQEDTYLLELVRYIHLNPIRGKLVQTASELDYFPWSGHSVILGHKKRDFQEVSEILGYFGKRVREARIKYQEFIKSGFGMKQRDDLCGGGLRRSAGGWEGVKALKRKKQFWRGDERILGDGEFVENVLKAYEEELTAQEKLSRKGWSINRVAEKLSKQYGIPIEILKNGSRTKEISEARAVMIFECIKKLGLSGIELSKYFNISRPAVSKAYVRGMKIAEQNKVKLIS